MEDAQIQISTRAQQRATLGQGALMWRKFRKHRLAMVGGVITAILYFVVIFAEFLAPYTTARYFPDLPFAPPQRIRLFHEIEGETRFQPHVLGYQVTIDTESFARTFAPDPEQIVPVRLFARGTEYRLFGLIRMGTRLIGPVNPEDPMFLMGSDRLGRDMLSRIIYGARVSMTIGLVGVLLSLILGIFLGGISGYFGGPVDNIIQRTMEFLQSMPQIPLWMGARCRYTLVGLAACRLFLDNGHSVHPRLDRSRARGSRQVHVAEDRRLCDRRANGRLQQY